MKIIPRKYFSNVNRILLHPAVIIIPFAIGIWMLIPGIHNRYKCELMNTQMQAEQCVCTYADFDNDGYSEHFVTGIWKGKAFCTFINKSESYLQLNFDGDFVPSQRFVCGDINHDHKKELFLFTVDHDSIFINVVDPVEKGQGLLHRKFLAVMENSTENTAWEIPKAMLYDLNRDGISEVVILLTAGYQTKPRRVYAYDLINDTIIASPDIGAYGLNLHIYTENSKPRIAVDNYASCNYSDTVSGMNDLSSYKIVLDENLHFRYQPREEKGEFSMYRTFPVYHNTDTMLVNMVMETANKSGWLLTVYDLAGKAMKSTFLNSDQENYKLFSTINDRSGNTRILGFYKADRIVLFDHNLEVIHKRMIKTERFWEYFPDLDQDGRPEFIFNSIQPNELVILRENLSSPVRIKIAKNGYLHPVNIILRGEKPPYFMLQIDSTSYIFKYYATFPLLQYSILAGIYILLLGFTLLIRQIQHSQFKKKFATQQTISELKFLSIRNQMDPHFTYNILNTIGSFILQNKPDESYRMLMNYSKLLRTTLHASDTILGTLQQELEFVTNYLELQKVRFKENLNYTIVISTDVDQSAIVPKMVIYTYVENSVKHGFSGLGKPGVINIKVSSDDSFIIISITDNGIGRKKASEKGTESGKGHKIMHQFYSLLNELNQGQISEQINDLFDEDGFPAGTEVILTVPTDLKFASGENQGDVYKGLINWRKSKHTLLSS